MKTNELAEIFVEQRQGFNRLAEVLRKHCTVNDQMAYNTIATLWILSYHNFALVYFGDYTLNIIELVSKVLDYYNKEKIVRIVCMLFDVRPSSNNNCLELEGKQGLSGPSLDDKCAEFSDKTSKPSMGRQGHH